MHYKTAYEEAAVMGSPDFMYNAGAISGSSNVLIDFETSTDVNSENRFGYAPFNIITVFNASAEIVRVVFNQDTAFAYTVPANSTQPIQFNGGVWSVRVINTGSGAIADGALRISATKSGIDTDKLSKKIGKWLFRG